MSIDFEPTKSFCYKFARYTLLDLIAKEPEALSGQPFKLVDVAKRVTERLSTPEQLATQIPAAQADRIDTIFGAIKFFATLHAKRLPSSPFKWLEEDLFLFDCENLHTANKNHPKAIQVANEPVDSRDQIDPLFDMKRARLPI